MATDYNSFPKVEKDAIFGVPNKQINSEADVARFMRSVARLRILGFVVLLNDAVKGKTCLDEDIHCRETILGLCRLLDELSTWIDEIPPSTGPRRFGNVAFREWMRRLEEVIFLKFRAELTPSKDPFY
jgi:serine/threonine-protein phosphatase 2A activator